ncbi:MAG: FimV family protein [Gammaproteobacteria bacterium]
MRKTIACGSMMMLALNPAQVGAVGLGEVDLKSRLGQPLEATVPLTLREGESLPKNCVKPALQNNSLAKLSDLRVTAPARNGPGTYSVRISTTNPLREPMYELSLMVQCPGATLLVRQYVLMLDLPGMQAAVTTSAMATNPVAATSSAAGNPPRVMPTRSGATASQAVTGNPARTLPPRADRIPAGSSYRVSRGDTLSTIAKRVDGRLPDTIWAVANKLFADNPQAFIRNDPNRIKLGSLIRIPEQSVLVAMSPGTRLSPAPAERAQTPSVSASPAPERANLPTRAQVATTRNTVAPQRRSAAPVPALTATNTTSTNWPMPGSEEADAVTKRIATEQAAESSEAPPTEQTRVATNDSESFNPFADEAPVAPIASTPAVDTTNTAAVAATNADDSAPGPSTALLSILIGLLLGAAASLLLLRGRLLAALGVRRQARPLAVKPRPIPATEDLAASGTFDSSLAAAAFDGSTSDERETSGFPISGPIEDTYIVETQEAEPTIQEALDKLQTEVIDSDTAEQAPASTGDKFIDDDDSAELAKLFGADEATSVADAAYTPSIEDPTAEMPLRSPEPLDPTVEMPQGQDPALDPTAAMPQPMDTEFFDPTAELPVDALDEIFDPTGGIDAPPGAAVEATLMEAFNEDIDNIDPDEMFATSNRTVEAFAVEATTKLPTAAETSEQHDPLADSMIDDPTIATDFGGLPMSDEEDDNLSATLQEALNLLERDFEEEFTASQILERSSLEKSLQEDLKRQDADDTDDDIKRKIS